MIELENIEKTYGSGSVTTLVLGGISFRIERGEYVAIMGSSGTGKSTLMNVLGCLDKPTAGQYRLDGVDVVNLDDEELSHLRNEKIGFVFQQFHLLGRTTALRNVMLPLIYTQEFPGDAEDRADAALVAVGLEEPTGNLDSRSGLEVLAIFKRLHRQGRTIVLVTHSEETAEHANRVILLKDGRVAEDRRIEQPRDAEEEKAQSEQEETAA